MNKSTKKVASVLLPQLGIFLALAAFTGYQNGMVVGIKLAGIALAAHVLWAPVYYAYLQRKARKEATAEELRLREWAADAPNREVRLAIAKAIAVHMDVHSQKGHHV